MKKCQQCCYQHLLAVNCLWCDIIPLTKQLNLITFLIKLFCFLNGYHNDCHDTALYQINIRLTRQSSKKTNYTFNNQRDKKNQ
jgi:hypothetical protein